MSEGVDEGYTPLPTRPQRSCDPASLFVFEDESANEPSFRIIKILKVSSSFLGTKTRILSIEGWLDRPTNGHTYVSRIEIFNTKLVGPKKFTNA